MIRSFIFFLFSSLAIAFAQSLGNYANSVQVYFSPNGGCTKAIVQALDQAKRSVRVQAYSFTSAPIAEALKRAYQRRIKEIEITSKEHITTPLNPLESPFKDEYETLQQYAGYARVI
jgi:phosphatidylserine/phosphatidylglycerophosphate/cardiolipin synthase-like enzyme